MKEQDNIKGDIKVSLLNEENINGVVDVFLEEQRYHNSWNLGKLWIKKYLLWFAQNPKCIAIVALQDDLVIGYALGAPFGYEKELNRAIALYTLLAFILRPWLIFNKKLIRRIRHVVLSIFSPKLSAFGAIYKMDNLPTPIMNYARAFISSQARGKGFGFQFYNYGIEIAQSLNFYRTIIGWVHKDNIPPNRLFEKLGFSIIAEDNTSNIWCKKFDQ